MILKSVEQLDVGNLDKQVGFYRQLLLLNETNDLGAMLKNIQELLSFAELIFSSPATAEVFFYFCLHGAATALILETELSMPEATVYRGVKRLRGMGVLSPAVKIRLKKTGGGPRPTIWALRIASTDEISKARKLHLQFLSPKYQLAEKIAQTILDEYVVVKEIKELSYKQIVIYIRELRIPFNSPDIAELAANYLQEKGIKVWR